MSGTVYGILSAAASCFLVISSRNLTVKHSPSYNSPVLLESTDNSQQPTKKVLPSRRLIFFYLIFCVLQTTISYFLYASGDLFPIFGFGIHFYLQFCVFLQLYLESRHKRLKPLWYRILFTWPSTYYLGCTWFSLPLLPLLPIATLFDYEIRPFICGITFLVGILGMYQSLANPKFCKEEVCIDLTPDSKMKQSMETKPHLYRVIGYKGTIHKKRFLNIFQVTDPHLGPMMSVERLSGICSKIVQAVKSGQIDLVFFTGDMETVETHDHDDALMEALRPLREINCVYACMGNHDYESYRRIKHTMIESGIKLLEDEECIAETRLGPVQIIGSIYTYAGEVGAHKHIQKLCAKYPKPDNALIRFMLIHNPSIFPHIPPDENVCVFSGHLHGGQIGIGTYTLLNFLSHTPLLRRMKQEFPDQGLYNKGRNLLYTHRGTGHYGFPLRLGIPSEQSIIRVYF
jgi:predicted MPP superfamily phosphohydrolase